LQRSWPEVLIIVSLRNDPPRRGHSGVAMGREGNTEAQRAPQTLAGTTPCPGPFARYPFVRY